MSARISPIKINPRDSRRNRAGLNWLLSLRSGLERYEIGFEARMDGNPRNMDDDEAGGKSVRPLSPIVFAVCRIIQRPIEGRSVFLGYWKEWSVSWKALRIVANVPRWNGRNGARKMERCVSVQIEIRSVSLRFGLIKVF